MTDIKIYKIVKLDEITPDEFQPRQEFDPQSLLRLRQSVEKFGIKMPLIVEERKGGGYMIEDGERRYRVAKALKLKEVPVLIRRAQTKEERLVSQFHLQEQHASWSAFDKARSILELQRTSNPPLETSELANSLGLARATVNDYLALANLSKRTHGYAVEKRLPNVYLTKLGHAMKKLEDKGLRGKLEAALLSKIDSGMIEKAKDIDKYGKAIRFGGEKIAENIIENKDYSPKQAARDAKTDVLELNAQVRYGVTWLQSTLRNAYAAGAYKQGTKEHATNMAKLAKELTKYADEIPENE